MSCPRPELAYAFHTPLRNADALCPGFFAGYRFTFASFDLSPRIEACRAGFENAYVQAKTTEIAASLRAVFTYDLPWITLDLGASGGPALFLQNFETAGIAPRRTTWAAHFGLTAGFTVDLPGGFDLFAEETLRTYVSSFRDERIDRSSIGPSLAFQQTIGVGKIW